MSQMFKLLTESNTPTVIGKAWWNEALKLTITGDARRTMMVVGGGLAAVVVGAPILGAIFGGDDEDDTRQEKRKALQAQREFGWSFGAADEANTVGYGPTSGTSVNLTAIMAPRGNRWTSVWIPTLFESLEAMPTSKNQPEDVRTAGFKPLRDVIQPEMPPRAITVHSEGTFLAQRLAHTKGVAVIVDLPGPDAVVYAAALAEIFDPVFLFDNWPHPRGVVQAHRTLATALQLAPGFAEVKGRRDADAPPVFVLDRTRLAPYTDDASQFDNRSLARLPTLAALKAAGIQHIYYVAPTGSVIDMDDVVEDLVAYQAGGIEVRAVVAADLPPPPSTTLPDGRVATRAATFAHAYNFQVAGAEPWGPPPPEAAWRPTPRSSPYASHQAPAGFGEVPVVVRAATGVLLGAAIYRSGSWNRAPVSSSYYGGG